jgi:transcriptional regulator with XRE-family HTH domain/quercetin dioxygenase-like cupin family protein
MPESHVPSLGDRIRAERVRRGVSLRALAREVGVSASMISQIETGKSRPSVSTLFAITTALGMSLQDVFDPAPPGVPEDEGGGPDAGPLAAAVTAAALAAGGLTAGGPAGGGLSGGGLSGGGLTGVGRAGRSGRAAAGSGPGSLPTTMLEALSARGPRLGPLVRPADRRVLTLDSGVTWERLGELPPMHVDFILLTYAPGGTSSSTGDLMRHPGWEWGFLMHGELVLTLGFEEIVVRAGDAVCFDSTTPHRYRNDGSVPASGVWFVVEDLP